MWIAAQLNVVERTFSLVAARGRSEHKDLALLADGVELSNMLRHVDWNGDPVQLAVCSDCGSVGCADGNYVSVRRLGTFVALIPSLASYAAATDDVGAIDRLAPPTFITRRGVTLLRVDQWVALRARGSPLVPPDTLRPMNWQEAWLSAQLERRDDLIGQPGMSPTRRLSSQVVASTPYLDAQELDRLGTREGWSAQDGDAVRLLQTDESQALALVLDTTLEEVHVFARVGEGYGLVVAPGFVVVPS